MTPITNKDRIKLGFFFSTNDCGKKRIFVRRSKEVCYEIDLNDTFDFEKGTKWHSGQILKMGFFYYIKCKMKGIRIYTDSIKDFSMVNDEDILFIFDRSGNMLTKERDEIDNENLSKNK